MSEMPAGYLSEDKFAHELEYQRQEEFGGESYAEFGRRYGMSDEGIRLVCKGKRSPPKSMLERFGLERVVFYRRKEA